MKRISVFLIFATQILCSCSYTFYAYIDSYGEEPSGRKDYYLTNHFPKRSSKSVTDVFNDDLIKFLKQKGYNQVDSNNANIIMSLSYKIGGIHTRVSNISVSVPQATVTYSGSQTQRTHAKINSGSTHGNATTYTSPTQNTSLTTGYVNRQSVSRSREVSIFLSAFDKQKKDTIWAVTIKDELSSKKTEEELAKYFRYYLICAESYIEDDTDGVIEESIRTSDKRLKWFE